MRPSSLFILIIVVFLGVDGVILCFSSIPARDTQSLVANDRLTASLGLTDLCLATEARYTRHLAVTDPVAPFMDGPSALEHFPSGSFYGVNR